MTSSHVDSNRPQQSMRDAALKVVRILQEAGHVAYWAGGCVRDMLLDREPKDYDVATAAHPQAVTALFRKTRQVGAQFGVILVRIGGHPIEVATFRTDHDYTDGRRPDRVTFGSAEDDAQRRDFTINGLFFDPVANTVHDYVGGRDDLARGRIRAIGHAPDRFAEDHLRILRAIKFAVRFGFEVEPTTWAAMSALAAQLRRISPERIRMELEAMLSCPARARAVELLAGCNAIDYLWPGSETLRDDLPRALRVLLALPDDSDMATATAALLIHRTPAVCADISRALRSSNEFTERVVWLVAHHRDFDNPGALTLADLKMLMARREFARLLDLASAVHRADDVSPERVEAIRVRASAIPPNEIAPPPLITGDDLAAMNIPAGPIYKRILDRLHEEQLNGDLVSKDAARDRAAVLYREMS